MYANKIRVSVTTVPLKGHILLIRIKQLILNVPLYFSGSISFHYQKSQVSSHSIFLASEIIKTYALVHPEINCPSP